MYWKELDVWIKADDLVIKIYKETARFPASEKYALSDQLKRASYSVPANIVEGHSRKTTKEFIQFLYHARGSLEELRYFILLSKDLNYLARDTYKHLEKDCETISKMLNGLINAMKQKLDS